MLPVITERRNRRSRAIWINNRTRRLRIFSNSSKLAHCQSTNNPLLLPHRRPRQRHLVV